MTNRIYIIYRHIRRHRPTWTAARCFRDAKLALEEPQDSIYRVLLLCYQPMETSCGGPRAQREAPQSAGQLTATARPLT